MVTIKVKQTKLESIVIEYTSYLKDKDKVNKILAEVLRDISHDKIQLIKFRWGFIVTTCKSEFIIKGNFSVEKCLIEIYKEEIVAE